MFDFLKKLKQINGYEPIDKKHLGQYSHMCKFKTRAEELVFSEHSRINSDVWLFTYKTNSVKVIVENRLSTQEFHLVFPPYISKGFKTYKTILVGTNTEVLIGIKEDELFMSFGGIGFGIKLYNL